jgi:hypothetical protein
MEKSAIQAAMISAAPISIHLDFISKPSVPYYQQGGLLSTWDHDAAHWN